MTIYLSTWARLDDLPGFEILYVCIANQCRSPMAERITRRELDSWPHPGAERYRVSSAGTMAVEGHPMHRHAARALRKLGADAENFGSRRVTPEIGLAAGLILTATEVERDAVIALVPATLPRAFTLLEFARLIAATTPEALALPVDPVERAIAMVEEARKLRGRVPYVDPSVDDLEDPPRTVAGFDRCAAIITTAVRAVLTGLFAVEVDAVSS